MELMERRNAGFICITVVLLCFGTESIDIREYCLREYFNATCESDDVILMTLANYGRMRLGRCVQGDLNLGCSNDVIGHFDALCSGRKSCEVSVRSLVDMKPCQRDFASYLEASYRCITVLDLRLAYCPPDGHLTITASSGFLSNTLYGSYSTLGRQSCPWVIHSRRGQRVQLFLIFLHSSVTESGNCPKVIVFDPEVGHTEEFNVCLKRARERHLYTSVGHHVTVYTSDMALIDELKFLLSFKVVGCPLLNVSGGVWVKSIGIFGDDLMIRCNDTLETWYVTCQGNRWVGDYGNCSLNHGDVYSSNGIQKRGPGSSSMQFLTQGLLLALGLGLILGISIAFLALLAICCFKHWCRPNDSMKALTSLTGGLGDEVSVVDRRFPALLADIETVAHLGLENVYVGGVGGGGGGQSGSGGCRRHCNGGGGSATLQRRKQLNIGPAAVCDLHLFRFSDCGVDYDGKVIESSPSVGLPPGSDQNNTMERSKVTKSDSDKIISSQLFSDDDLLCGERYPPGLRTPEHRPCIV